jgi:PAS domain S-box-containing protein
MLTGDEKVKILMVDDRPENLLALEAVLTSSHYHLVKAMSGEEALRWVLKEEFAVILLDVQMPGIDGFETARLIRSREKSKSVPIIFVTAISQTPANVLHGYSVGAIDYIFKPFQPEILKSKVDGFVRINKYQHEIEKQGELLQKRTADLEQANEKLNETYRNLESLVNERTQELIKSNQLLQQEIDEKKQMVSLIKESEQRYRQLVEESPEAIMIQKLNSDTWFFINQTGLTLFGASSREQITCKPWFNFVHEEDYPLMRANLDALHKGQKVDVFEVRFVRLDKEVIDVEVKIIPFMYQGEPSFHTVVRDRSELNKSRKIIQESDKFHIVGELAAGIAHEIRNPLTSLRGFVQLLDFQKETGSDYYRIMLSEIDRINSIVSELLLLAKPKTIDYKRADLKVLINSIILLLNAQANLYGVVMKPSFHTEEGSYLVYCEENKLKQVFINILKNAIEAMTSGGHLQVDVKLSENKALILFSDEGPGIPKNHLAKIGQPFYTTKEKGTGLGLMISKSIIENHKGMMRIESELGQGTTVEITLPINPVTR